MEDISSHPGADMYWPLDQADSIMPKVEGSGSIRTKICGSQTNSMASRETTYPQPSEKRLSRYMKEELHLGIKTPGSYNKHLQDVADP